MDYRIILVTVPYVDMMASFFPWVYARFLQDDDVEKNSPYMKLHAKLVVLSWVSRSWLLKCFKCIYGALSTSSWVPNGSIYSREDRLLSGWYCPESAANTILHGWITSTTGSPDSTSGTSKAVKNREDEWVTVTEFHVLPYFPTLCWYYLFC